MEALGRQLGALHEQVHQLEYTQRVQVLCGAVAACSCALFALRRATPSYAALAVVLPIIALNAWLPTLFGARDELITRVITALLTAWLANFKAVGMCLNRGPLADRSRNLFQFSLLYLMPIYPRQEGPVKKGRLTDSAGGSSKLVGIAAGHAVAMSVFAYILVTVPMPTPLKHYFYALGLCSFVSFIMNGPAAVLIALAELDVVPPFDRPWLADSLADFWSRRWNNTVSLTLRSLIYDPIAEGSVMHHTATKQQQQPKQSKQQPKQQQQQQPRASLAQRLAGLAATFAASGVMHEFMLLYALQPGDAYPAGFWFVFFFVQFPLLAAEDVARKRLRAAGVVLPRPLLMAATTGVLLATSFLFWYPPIEHHTDVAPRIVASVNAGAAAVVGAAQGLVAQLGVRDVAQAAAAVSSAAA